MGEKQREQDKRNKEKNVTYFDGFNYKFKLSHTKFMPGVLHIIVEYTTNHYVRVKQSEEH